MSTRAKRAAREARETRMEALLERFEVQLGVVGACICKAVRLHLVDTCAELREAEEQPEEQCPRHPGGHPLSVIVAKCCQDPICCPPPPAVAIPVAALPEVSTRIDTLAAALEPRAALPAPEPMPAPQPEPARASPPVYGDEAPASERTIELFREYRETPLPQLPAFFTNSDGQIVPRAVLLPCPGCGHRANLHVGAGYGGRCTACNCNGWKGSQPTREAR